MAEAIALTIAVVDALIKYGERTAELISDARAFHDDSAKLYQLVVGENLQNKLLRNLLFAKCWVYGDKSLFEQFDQDIQQQIVLLFVEIKSILREGLDLLERRYGLSNEPPNRITQHSSTNSLSSIPGSVGGRTSPSIPVLLRWSFRDKKRVEAILLSFSDRNSKLKSQVELWCLASHLGMSPEHLMHLKTDESSKGLGFDKDASLCLERCGKESVETSLELSSSWDPYLKDSTPRADQGTFTVFLKESMSYVQERHRWDPTHLPGDSNSTLDRRTKGRVESLAKLLHQPKEQIFRILPCVGWKHTPDQSSIAFVFKLQDPLGAPVSLQRVLLEFMEAPALGDKFQLALGLCQCIAQVHMVQWLHESFRSDNILLLPRHMGATSGDRLGINYAEPWVLGFEFSRPESYFSNGHADFEPARDIYRHPSRQGQPMEIFNKLHDIYALGVVLLEIGLWEPAIKLEKNLFAHTANPSAVQAQLIKHAERRLGPRVGHRYKEAVLKCLNGDFGVEGDTKDDMKLQLAFRHQVVDVIEKAASSV